MKQLLIYLILILILFGCNNYKRLQYSKTNSKNTEVATKEMDTITNKNFLLDSLNALSKVDTVSVQFDYFNYAFGVSGMLDSTYNSNFKIAVFLVENAFFDGRLDYDVYNLHIRELFFLAELFERSNIENFEYDKEDKSFVLKHAAIYKTMKDTISISFGADTISHMPFLYNFDDFNGAKNWQNTFVSELLKSGKGNCQSLSYLYKILADEYEIETHLALAPNHMYIKHASVKSGMYNTELTNASFPDDAWIMASGYISLNAIKNGIYMEALDEKQSLSLTLFDLAKAYEKKYGIQDGEFMLKCCHKALEHYPQFINAKLLKERVLKSKIDEVGISKEYETLILDIYNSGYRKMPEEMYRKWLQSINSNFFYKFSGNNYDNNSN